MSNVGLRERPKNPFKGILQWIRPQKIQVLGGGHSRLVIEYKFTAFSQFVMKWTFS